MQRRIDFLGESYLVTVLDRMDGLKLRVGDKAPLSVSLSDHGNSRCTIRLGNDAVDLQMAIKGETAYIRAFERTFALKVVDPVEQAGQEAGDRGNSARAPMPGTVVEINVRDGDRVERGWPLMTIESMKILTVIKAPRNGKITTIHVKTGQTFDKNDLLVTLTREEG